MEMFTCTKCKIEQPITEFYKDPLTKRGHSSHCATCHRARVKKWAKDNPKRHNANGQNWKKNNPRKIKNSQLVYHFGITLEEFERLKTIQDNKCAICGFEPHLKALAVDHDHSHHENPKRGCRECVRGLLCNDCNRIVLWVLEANPKLQSDFIIAYLKQRPFASRPNKIIQCGLEAPTPISPKSHSGVPQATIPVHPELPINGTAQENMNLFTHASG